MIIQNDKLKLYAENGKRLSNSFPSIFSLYI